MMLNLNLSSAALGKSIIVLIVTITLCAVAVRPQNIPCDTSLQGFATLELGTTGGGEGTPVTVTTTIEEMRRACEGDQPEVIMVMGTIPTGPIPVTVGSNKSIIGVNGATIQGGLYMAPGTSNVIIRYLTLVGAGFGNLPEDTITVRGTTNVWIDHCNLSDAGDNLLEIAEGSDLVTVSWNKFSYTNAGANRIASLVGALSSDGYLDRGRLRVTYHNNHFGTHVTEGMARVRFGQTHFVNNLYNAPGNNFVIGVGTEASLLIENNYFLDVNNPITVCDNDNTLAHVTETGNIYNKTSGTKVTGPINGDGTPFTKAPYAFNAIPATEVEKVVLACANANGTPFTKAPYA